MHEIKLSWLQQEQFDILQNGKHLRIDAADESVSTGFRPKALILSSLAGCTAIDVVELLNKMRVNFSKFDISVKAELTEEHPKIYHKVWITYHVKVNDEDRSKVQRAVELSQEKYCGVSAMVKKFAQLYVDIEYL